MRSSPIALRLAALLLGLSTSALASAADNRITPTLDSIAVMHKGQAVSIERGQDPEAVLPEIYQKTDRGCPPYCVQPMQALPGVETIGELEMLDYLARLSAGDTSILIVDSRTPDWVLRGTIPGAVNIPWNSISRDRAGALDSPREADALQQVMTEQFGARASEGGAWDFSSAKTLVLFCNGIWCPQSTANIKTLAEAGYPLERIKWYRGGMQDWLSVGLTTVTP
ncbi:MAG: rhodanese-like domain-containing protein [Chromatiaceae bacterium]|nr:rhodanese-like domain-containing protein [Chromatiaceae bacterium]